MSDIPIGDIARAYQNVKDARTAARHKWEEQDEEMEKDQKRLQAALLESLNSQKADSIKTEAGTVYRRVLTKASGADWGAVWAWAKEHDQMDIFERRIKVGTVTDYMEENDGQVPPGVNVYKEMSVSVRRS